MNASRPLTARVVLGVLALALIALLLFLGTWQVERRAWKLDLIARVDARVHAPAVDAPGPSAWPQVSAATCEYLHVRLQGHWLAKEQTLVQAATALGSGYWVLAPLQRSDGSVVLINRGFVPASSRTRVTIPDADQAVTLTGLLRLSEPGGGFLRQNDPGANRWYSRDVQAIAAARGLARTAQVAPYFIDADASADRASPDAPVGGLTVVSFHNSHLVYAITWYALALMVAGGALRVLLPQLFRPSTATPAD